MSTAKLVLLQMFPELSMNTLKQQHEQACNEPKLDVVLKFNVYLNSVFNSV